MAEIKVSNKAIKRSVGTPSDQYDSMRAIWAKCRAIIRGQESTKSHDEYVNDYDDNGSNTNLLLPFSPSMTQPQYDFFKDEAELPGITSQYSKSMIGALLRKDATLSIPDRVGDEMKEEIEGWLRHQITSDNLSLFHFLDDAMWEEMQTGYGWVYVDVPSVSEEEFEAMTDDQRLMVKPYPSLLPAETVINVIHGKHPITKAPAMLRFITRYFTEVYTPENPWHPTRVDTVRDHYLDDQGWFKIDEYRMANSGDMVVVDNGVVSNDALDAKNSQTDSAKFDLFESFEPKRFGERLDRIPAWPLDGESKIEDPHLLTFVNREVSLYNKVSRRNHLMYGAATYTPVVTGVMDEDEQAKIVMAGLGSWIFLEENATIDTLAPPTDALNDMQTAIESTMEELGKMGIRMLSPETAQSGVALELRNAGQTASLGTLNIKISTTLRHVFTFMINWRYDLDLSPDELEFNMSSDFTPQAQGEAAMRMIGEWYQMGIIPRSVFIEAARKNDYVGAEYMDELGIEEIETDPVRQAAMDAMNPKIEE